VIVLLLWYVLVIVEFKANRRYVRTISCRWREMCCLGTWLWLPLHSFPYPALPNVHAYVKNAWSAEWNGKLEPLCYRLFVCVCVAFGSFLSYMYFIVVNMCVCVCVCVCLRVYTCVHEI